ncbi:MAG: hypothetical protein WC069_06445 [Candidatus Shapirobacteria bacterium]
MKSPNLSAGRDVKVDAGWIYGMNTLRHPWLLREDQYQRGVNIVNRGGVVQTRPGFSMQLILPPGNLQGFTYFRKTRTNENSLDEVDYLVAAVDGKIYASPHPFIQPRDWSIFQVPGVSFDPLAKMVHLVVAQKNVSLLPDDTLSITPAYNVLMMQDGINPAAYWDGLESRHLDEKSPALETPLGTWMAYSGGRLWVARGKVVLASDAYDPLKFTERVSGESRGDFSFPREVTGIAPFIGDQRQEIVVVFTNERSEILQSGVRDRAKWASTANFQSVLFPSVGCIAGRSIAFQSGLMWWYGLGGLVSSDTAATTYLTSQVNFRDAEMAFSKQYLAEDQSGICGVSFENFLLMSVPVKQNLNSETFVMDYASVAELSSSERIPAWAGIWTGIRPVQWASAFIGSKHRVFAASVDYASVSLGSHNHIWEAFTPDREDRFFVLENDFSITSYRQPIFCEMETRLLGDGLDLKKLSYAEIDLRELSGFPVFQVRYRGVRGAYKQLLCSSLSCPTEYDNAGSSLAISEQDTLGDLRKQSRRVITQNTDDADGQVTCESGNAENIDKAFSLLLRWCGQLAVEALRVFLDVHPEESGGRAALEDGELCFSAESGQNYIFPKDEGFIPADDLYAFAGQTSQFASKQTYTAESVCPDQSLPLEATATAQFVSNISQADADAQALQAATETALAALAAERLLHPCS